MQNKQKDPYARKSSLNNPQNLENCLNKDINRIKRKASKIVTLLPENSLTPIPNKDVKNKGLANNYDKKELNDAQRTAVFIRRMEYATTTKRKMDEDNKLKNNSKKIALIQQWWKTMHKIIKLQKNMRGFLFRKKLMNNLEHQEKLLQFITEFDNIHSYHLYKQFMDNLKQKRDYENSKLMEKCEDFNEKLDNLEKLHNYKNFKNCFNKWKEDTKKKKKEDLDNLAKKLNDILKNKENEDKMDALDKIKEKFKNEEEKLNDKIKDFQEKQAKKKFLNDLIKAHRLNKILNNIKNNIDDKNKKDVLDKLKQNNDIAKAIDKLKKILEDKMKKDTLNDLKTMDFVDKLNNLINKHNDRVNDEAKKDFINNLKDINNKNVLKNALNKWKNFNDEMKNRNKILNKLRRHKLNELREKEKQEKNKLAISSGVNDFELISDIKEENKNANKDNQIFISSQNDINILAQPTPPLILSHDSQNFSLVPPELDKFEFFEPFHKNKKLDKTTIPNQLNSINSFLENKLKNEEEEKKKNLEDLAKKLNDVLTKSKKESDDKLKKDVIDKLKKINDIAKGTKILNDLMNKIPKKEVLNTLKKNSGISEGFRNLNKFLNNKLKKDVMDKLKENNDKQRALEDLDKLLLDKYRKKFLNNIKTNKDLNTFTNSLEKYVKDNSRKQFFEKFKNKDDCLKQLQKLDKLINNKIKKDSFEEFKKNNKIGIGSNKLEKVVTDGLRNKFLDRLKKNNDIKNAVDKLEKFINNKLKKDIFDSLKKNNNIKKGVEKLDKIINDNNNKIKKDTFDKLKTNDDIAKAGNKLEKLLNNKLKKDTYDQLKKNDNIGKGAEKLEDLINNQLKDDTFRKLKTMDFVDILKNMKNKHDNDDKKEILDNLKKLQNKGKEEEKNKLKNALDKLKNQIDRDKFLEKFKDLLNKKILEKSLDKWNETAAKRNILEKLKPYKKKENDIKRQKQLNKTLKHVNENNIKKYFDKWKENAFKSYPKSKRISRRRSPKKLRNKSRKNNDKKLLKKAFNKWKKISSFDSTRNVLEQIKKNKALNDKLNDSNKDDLYDKYKKKVLQVLSNIYKTHRDSLLKKYFDKWRKTSKSPNDREVKEILKYKKKPKLLDKREENSENQDTNQDKDYFKPKYYFQKRNLYNRVPPLYNNLNVLSNEKYNPSNPNLTNYKSEKRKFYEPRNLTTIKNIPYKKKYGQRALDYESSSQNQEDNNYDEDEIPKDEEILGNNNKINIEENYPTEYKDKENEELSDTSSNNESLLNGVPLIQSKETIRQPRNYTSQSFFIDKNAVNEFNKNNNYQLNTNNNNNNANQLPMTMKGDFVSLIEQNPKILSQKNPRIQVTNATCDLNQIINKNNDEDGLNDQEINDEIDKLQDNYIIDKNRVLNKVIQNCDKDLYATQKPFNSKKDKWFSVSIPLNDNEAKWEFLNNIKGERDKNNINKFELIQNEIEPKNIEKNEEPYSTRTFKPGNSAKKQKKNTKDASYKLQEMNFSQFYRSPIRPRKIIEDKKFYGNSVIRRPGKKRNILGSPSFLSKSISRDKKRRNENNYRTKGNIRFDPRFRSIEYDVGNDDEDYNYSDE